MPVLKAATRRRARALQLLYAWEVQRRPPLERTSAALLKTYPRCRGAIEDAERLVSEVTAAVESLDSEIAEAAEHWRLDRIGTVERNILRLSLYELRQENVPVKVVITEGVQLAHWFAGAMAPAFVNGVLDAVARRAGRL